MSDMKEFDCSVEDLAYLCKVLNPKFAAMCRNSVHEKERKAYELYATREGKDIDIWRYINSLRVEDIAAEIAYQKKEEYLRARNALLVLFMSQEKAMQNYEYLLDEARDICVSNTSLIQERIKQIAGLEADQLELLLSLVDLEHAEVKPPDIMLADFLVKLPRYVDLYVTLETALTIGGCQ